ncbi:hypothetical protein B9Z19DRAFT_1135423 [Tuber borchii]|uniref:Uncharacterized protein n=1 Tax=Tuber borchii TaxID=42251 RepID=A0A2T6ZCU9_TUBBO|nr:hypothetical protein B9Z19DRAFT_1135423 [Tuber borchii]
MEMILSPITSTPETQRVIGTILSGEYESIVKKAEEGNKRVRNSLVAKDLSWETQYTLEWPIGMVLRDGDTLMVIYAINQNTVEDGGKIVPDDRIAGNLSGQAAAMGTSFTAINIPHPEQRLRYPTLGIFRRGVGSARRLRGGGRLAEAITRLVRKPLGETRLQVGIAVGAGVRSVFSLKS